MTTGQAENLLLNYPDLWQSYHTRREQILHGGTSSSDWTSSVGHGGGGYSDRTAAKAVALAEMGFTSRRLIAIGRWIDEYLQPDYRVILVCRWRKCSWQQIARQGGFSQLEARNAWQEMIMGLRAFVGNV